jgi:DNA-binding GntR family transcriptional regulator
MEFSEIFQPNIQWDKDARDGTQLAQRVTEHLRKMIMDGVLPPETQLPNEPDLAAFLNISRSTVRSALTILEQGGFIQRRWGVGTFVTKNPPTYDNLSLNSGVTQMIRSSGAEPGSAELLLATRPANERVSSQLSIELGTPTLVIERVRLANDLRAVFTVDVLPLSLFQTPGRDISLADLEKHIICLWISIMVLHGSVRFLQNNTSLISFKFAWGATYFTWNKWILIIMENPSRYQMNIMSRMRSGSIFIDQVKE